MAGRVPTRQRATAPAAGCATRSRPGVARRLDAGWCGIFLDAHRRLTQNARSARRTGRAAGPAARGTSAGTSTPRPRRGTKKIVSPRTTPTRIAAITTPQKLPSPPMTTTTKAAVMISAPIGGMNAGDRGEQHAGKRRPARPDRHHRRHDGRQRDAERARPCRGSARRRSPPGRRRSCSAAATARHGERGDRQHGQPVVGEDEIADEHLPPDEVRDLKRAGGPRPRRCGASARSPWPGRR